MFEHYALSSYALTCALLNRSRLDRLFHISPGLLLGWLTSLLLGQVTCWTVGWLAFWLGIVQSGKMRPTLQDMLTLKGHFEVSVSNGLGF